MVWFLYFKDWNSSWCDCWGFVKGKGSPYSKLECIHKVGTKLGWGLNNKREGKSLQNLSPYRGHFTTKYIYSKFLQKKCSSNKTIIFLPKKSPIICIHLHKGKSPFRVCRFYIRILQIMSSVPQEYSFQLILLLGLHRYFSQKEIQKKYARMVSHHIVSQIISSYLIGWVNLGPM